jgi:hypothetical protein
MVSLFGPLNFPSWTPGSPTACMWYLQVRILNKNKHFNIKRHFIECHNLVKSGPEILTENRITKLASHISSLNRVSAEKSRTANIVHLLNIEFQ